MSLKSIFRDMKRKKIFRDIETRSKTCLHLKCDIDIVQLALRSQIYTGCEFYYYSVFTGPIFQTIPME